MDLNEIVPTSPSPQLSHGLDERCTFNVTHRTTKFNYAGVRLFIRVIHGLSCNALDPVLNTIRDVRNDLYSLAQVVTTSFPLDDMLVNLARGDTAFSREGNVEVAEKK